MILIQDILRDNKELNGIDCLVKKMINNFYSLISSLDWNITPKSSGSLLEELFLTTLGFSVVFLVGFIVI